MFVLFKCKEISKCTQVCPYGFLPLKSALCVQYKFKPKPGSITMNSPFFYTFENIRKPKDLSLN